MPRESKETKLLRSKAGRTTPVMAYGYSRVSHTNSFKKGDSLPAQEKRIEDYYHRELAPQGITFGGCYNDGQSVSAYRVPFALRPAGQQIMGVLQPGDYLIIDKPDRIWRSMTDFVKLMEELYAKGITVHIVDWLGQTITNESPMGKFVLQMLVLIAELESSIKSQRIKEGVAHAVTKGKVKRPYIAGVEYDTDGRMQWNRKEQAVAQYIKKLRNPDDIRKPTPPWSQLFDLIEEFECQLYGRGKRTIAAQHRDRKHRWRYLYRNLRAFEYLGITHPSQLPDVGSDKMQALLVEACRQWEREKTERRKTPTTAFYRERQGKDLNRYSDVEVIKPEQLLKMI